MFGTLTNPGAAYRKAGIETQVDTSNPHKLVLMLYDGALAAIGSAAMYMELKQIARKGEAISKAIEIIESGLRACLDYQAGGQLAERLGALYEYMCARLLYANLKNDPAALTEVKNLLLELKGAWQEIANDPAVLQPNRAAA